jgi:hypothetical protein
LGPCRREHSAGWIVQGCQLLGRGFRESPCEGRAEAIRLQSGGAWRPPAGGWWGETTTSVPSPQVKIMVTVAVRRGDSWSERTLTLAGPAAEVAAEWAEEFPRLMERALKAAPAEADVKVDLEVDDE